MAVRTRAVTVSCAGGAGVATGTASTSFNPCKLLGISVLEASAPTGAVTVTVANQNRNVVAALPTGNVSGAAGPKFFPTRENTLQPNGTATPAGDDRWETAVLNGPTTVSIALGEADPNPQTPWATVTFYYETE